MRTCLFLFAALLLASLATLSPAPSRADAAAVGPPSVAILSPADGAVIPLNTMITFSAVGFDFDGAPLVRGQLQWTSSPNMFLGTDSGFVWNSSSFALGTHTITLRATGGSWQTTVQVTIWIGPPPTATPTSTFTNTPTSTPTPTATNTPTAAPTSTSTNTPTSTPTPLPTNTPTSSPTSTATATSTPAPVGAPPPAAPPPAPAPGRRCPDFDGDGRVGWRDLLRIANAVEHHSQDPKFDLNDDGRVGWPDLWAALRRFGQRCDGTRPSPPPRHGHVGDAKPE